MPKVTCFEDLIAWQKARELTSKIMDLTKSEELSKNYALKDQLCRAAISVSTNIAEGFERDGNKEFIKFLSIAKGSVGEVRSLLYLAQDQGHITREQMERSISLSLETARLIGGLIRYLKSSDKKGAKFVRTGDQNRIHSSTT